MPESHNPRAVDHIWCAVAVYNNRETLRAVVEGCLNYLGNVVVVDDGCTDADVRRLLDGLDVTILRHERNMGKGEAILTASRYIEKRGGLYMITIDADGQHNPDDILKFIPVIAESETALIVGARDFSVPNIPGSSRFGRRFANFWLRVETGQYIDDCQSGFRAYPVRYLNQLVFRGRHYDFEAEVLAKAAWAGLTLKTVKVSVYYPRPEDRVSSFRPFVDNLRLSLVHSMLVLMRLVPFGHKRLVPGKKFDLTLLLHPGIVLRMLMKENATPEGLALSAAVGSFLSVLPILFAHTAVILYVAVRFNLNKIVALNVQHLFMPPFVPALCIELGFYVRHGRWLTDLSFETVFRQFSDRLYEWLLGSLIVAPIASLLVGGIVFFAARAIQRRYA